MNIEALEKSKIFKLYAKITGDAMESRFRHWLFDPVKTLQGADIQLGQTVLEVGCGSGFFTVPAAQLIGHQGSLVAMDVSSEYVERVSKKVQAANLRNVRVVKGDALDTGLDAESMDAVLLFGVIPFPMLPLNRLLPEMHRVLNPEGVLAVWLFPISFGVPKSILRSGLFEYSCKRNGVYNYRRC